MKIFVIERQKFSVRLSQILWTRTCDSAAEDGFNMREMNSDSLIVKQVRFSFFPIFCVSDFAMKQDKTETLGFTFTSMRLVFQ